MELSEAKENALADMRLLFEEARVSVYGQFVPQYEQASWGIQVEEAKRFNATLPRGLYPTPYLDAFLAECPNDKDAFCGTILRNHERFARAMGKVNGVQTRYWREILAANTESEVDEILDRAAKAANELQGGTA